MIKVDEKKTDFLQSISGWRRFVWTLVLYAIVVQALQALS